MIRPHLAKWLVPLFFAAAASPAAAQAPHPPARPAAPTAPVTSPPQQTTATFGDWTLRCTQLPTARVCEVVQSFQQNEKTVAQIAIGRPAAGQKLQMTLLVPPNVALQSGPNLLPGRQGDAAPLVGLTWRRCIPIGCLADAALSPEVVTRLRGWTEPGRVVFTDAADRAAGLPLGPRGLGQALDALAKEDGPG